MDFTWDDAALVVYEASHAGDGAEVRIPMTGGQAVVNPKGVWHTADVQEPGRVLYIKPGLGTEHRPR